MDQNNSKVGRSEFSPLSDGDIVSLRNVVNMDRNAGISANSMLFHEGD